MCACLTVPSDIQLMCHQTSREAVVMSAVFFSLSVQGDSAVMLTRADKPSLAVKYGEASTHMSMCLNGCQATELASI